MGVWLWFRPSYKAAVTRGARATGLRYLLARPRPRRLNGRSGAWQPVPRSGTRHGFPERSRSWNRNRCLARIGDRNYTRPATHQGRSVVESYRIVDQHGRASRCPRGGCDRDTGHRGQNSRRGRRRTRNRRICQGRTHAEGLHVRNRNVIQYGSCHAIFRRHERAFGNCRQLRGRCSECAFTDRTRNALHCHYKLLASKSAMSRRKSGSGSAEMAEIRRMDRQMHRHIGTPLMRASSNGSRRRSPQLPHQGPAVGPTICLLVANRYLRPLGCA